MGIWVLTTLIVGSDFAFADFNARLKLLSTYSELRSTDILRETEGSGLSDTTFDLRLLWNLGDGAWKFQIEPTFTTLTGESYDFTRTRKTAVEQQPGSDANRFFKLTKHVTREDYHAITRFDRLALRYRTATFGLTIGRDAVSWGNGLVFQPLDLFNPYAPTTVDREYKPGADLVLVEQLLANGAEFQALFIARKEQSDFSLAMSTMAVKWQSHLGEMQWEIILAEHYDDGFYGFSLQVPVLQTLLRTDLARLCTKHDCYSSGITNLDYTFTFKGSLIYLFGEWFHNGFGLDTQGEDGSRRAMDLSTRLQRGEVFSINEDYVAVGIRWLWHPLVSQTVSRIVNMQDRSSVLQSTLTYDFNDKTLFQAGLVLPSGKRGDEYGETQIESDHTYGGGASVFVSVSVYR